MLNQIKYRKKTVLFSAMMLLFSACASKETNEDHGDARALYEELKETVMAYTDSMKNAEPDSTRIEELSERYEKRMADISFKYPAETDSRLTEGQNNDLYRLISAYITARSQAYNHPLPTDTIQEAITDSGQIGRRE